MEEGGSEGGRKEGNGGWRQEGRKGRNEEGRKEGRKEGRGEGEMLCKIATIKLLYDLALSTAQPSFT